ncbi:AhpC/TSA family protein [Shewanella mesophila]|uniref:peroxiredoxin-like family protein n=1 Tax=Shewanella mesophila TaxID=2864208 RepID=UPI001C661EE8|nr:peroxiredoxin-like family protein [Shewanella mesophila]QYJ85388.1 AhpC/TSA family protein [Shewanella mesophila]
MNKVLLALFILLISLPSMAKPIAQDELSISPLLNGQTIPSVTVTELNGDSVSLAKLTANKPSVIFFYRGGWCPFCNAQMGQLKAIEQDLINMGFQLIGISPDSPDALNASLTKQKLDYTLLSDAKLDAMRAFGLAYFTSAKTTKAYQSKLQVNNQMWKNSDGDERLVLPVPAIYIIDKNGLVHFQYVNPNYKVRADPKLILTAASLVPQ